jgi:hypothetical protein
MTNEALWQLDSNEKQDWPAQHEHTQDCFAHGCRFNVNDLSVPESMCEAYGWLFHETNGDYRVNRARQLLRDSLTKEQQQYGIKMAKENGATLKRMSTR